MAHILPDGWRELAVTGAAQREIETLARLADALPDDYSVYHAVHWTNLERGYSVFGEIDFIVMNRAGHLLLIEQKAGFLDETPEGLVKRYPGRVKSVVAQLAKNVEALRGKLNARPDAPAARIDYLFYCPDYHVRKPHSAGISPERIIDAGHRDALPALIQSVLPAGEAGAAKSEEAQKVHRFLCDVIQLETDVSALVGRARSLVARISGGLAHWARQLEFTPFRLRVTGTAGSGKTQLALAEFRATLERGGRPLYLCYNRPLADHFRSIAPDGGVIATFHAFCQQRLRAAGQAPDFSQPDAFERMVTDAAQLPVEDSERFDAVIIDEGQDFSEDWRDLALSHARAEGRLFWLEDPLQNLYARAPVALPGWVGIRSFANYRCPRAIVRLLQPLLPVDMPIEAASPIDASEVEILTYTDEASLLQALKEGIRLCYSEGFRKEDLAVVTWAGRNNSRLLSHDRIGPHTMRRFTGEYDLLGAPVFSEGDVLIESVYRFKGQSAPAVVFAEIDFETLDERALRKLFVGATRAMMKLVLVISERSASVLNAAD
ncbi:MAG: NERD domain-containing protein/DEAD/DEAH box helicase [Rhodocyclaceae bacterium]|nr:NERD domain-containing protein/DEAD/DEAH box helicase [Rhodocyclaceae bacterium]